MREGHDGSAVAIPLRPARPGDAAAVAALLAMLGHPALEKEVRARLQRADGRDRAGVLVADAGGVAVGVVAWDTYEQLHRPWPVCRVTTVAVDAGHRRQGIARALLAEIEGIARGYGCGRLEVITTHGGEAHGLYRSFGFEEAPVRYVKDLTAA